MRISPFRPYHSVPFVALVAVLAGSAFCQTQPDTVVNTEAAFEKSANKLSFSFQGREDLLITTDQPSLKNESRVDRTTSTRIFSGRFWRVGTKYRMEYAIKGRPGVFVFQSDGKDAVSYLLPGSAKTSADGLSGQLTVPGHAPTQFLGHFGRMEPQRGELIETETLSEYLRSHVSGGSVAVQGNNLILSFPLEHPAVFSLVVDPKAKTIVSFGSHSSHDGSESFTTWSNTKFVTVDGHEYPTQLEFRAFSQAKNQQPDMDIRRSFTLSHLSTQVELSDANPKIPKDLVLQRIEGSKAARYKTDENGFTPVGDDYGSDAFKIRRMLTFIGGSVLLLALLVSTLVYRRRLSASRGRQG